MVVQFTNLGINLFQADAAQQVQNLFNLGERMNSQLAALQSQDEGKMQATEQVQDTTEVVPREIDADGRRAHSHALPPKKPAPAEEKPPDEPPPPDPSGRGQIVDLQG